jgi:hypothetical protein
VTEFRHELLKRPLSDRDEENRWAAYGLAGALQAWALETWPPEAKKFTGREVMQYEGSEAKKGRR